MNTEKCAQLIGDLAKSQSRNLKYEIVTFCFKPIFLEIRKIFLSNSFLIQVSSRDSLWRRVVEMSKGSVDMINALTGKELPQAFKTAGLNENSV